MIKNKLNYIYITFILLSSGELRALLKGPNGATWQCWDLNS